MLMSIKDGGRKFNYAKNPTSQRNPFNNWRMRIEGMLVNTTLEC